ncbi:hypothetical protein F5879DRAFT_922255 [Lentinula edodes]|nr:hypothetical protein F5879DRAFT_922255 [Lentinula edodes]
MEGRIRRIMASLEFAQFLRGRIGVKSLDLSDCKLTTDSLYNFPTLESVEDIHLSMADVVSEDIDFIADTFPNMTSVTFVIFRQCLPFDIFLEMAKSWPAHTLKVKTRQCAPGIDRSLLMTNLSSVLDEAQELIHARKYIEFSCYAIRDVFWALLGGNVTLNCITEIEIDYTLRESLAWAMIPSYKCTSFENRPGFLKYAAHLWAARFPEDERGGQPSEEERTIQAKHADLPQPHELESWIANYTEDWMWNAQASALSVHSPTAIKSNSMKDLFLRSKTVLIKDYTSLDLASSTSNQIIIYLLPLLPPPYAHLKSVPRRSIFTPMRWMYPLPGVDFKSFDQAMDELNDCISDSKSLIRNMDSGSHEGCEILALACMLRDEENDEDEEVSDKENQVPTTDYSETDALYWPTSEVDIGSAGKGDVDAESRPLNISDNLIMTSSDIEICATAGGHNNDDDEDDEDDHLFANSSDVEFCNPIGDNNADDNDNLFVNSSDIEICNSTGDNNDDEDNVFAISSDIGICDAISDNNDDDDANDVDDHLWSETTYVNALVDNQDLKFCVEEDGIFKKKDHVGHDLRISLLAVPRLLLSFSNPVDNTTPLQNHLLFCYTSNLLYAKNHGRVHLTDALPPLILDLVKRLFLDTMGFADALSSTSSSSTGFLASTSEKAMASFVYHAALFIVSAMPRQRQKPIDSFDSHYLSDLRDLEEPSTQFLSTFFPSNPQHASIRHRDAAPSFKVSLGHRVVSSRLVVPTELLYSLPVEPPIIDAASHPYVTHAAPNEYLCTDFSPSEMGRYAFNNPALSGDLNENEEVINTSLESSKASNELRDWHANHVEEYIHELLQHEGRGPSPKPACPCGMAFDDQQPNLRSFRCTECFDSNLWCAECIVSNHEQNPLHIIQAWNGTFFESLELSSLGLVIHLGPHSATSPCWQAINHKPRPFTIIGVQRIHAASIKFCSCQKGSDLDRRQLLAAGLLPATTTHPQTAATFEFLNFFQILSFMSKASVSEYYQTLERVTNNIGTFVPPNRLREVLRMIRQWRFLMTLKRSGQGHNPEGVLALKPGLLAVKCLTCAHPGKNVPSLDDPVDPEKEWLYKRFEGLDANFRWTRLNISSEAKDPSFNKGSAFFCDDHEFQCHLLKMSGKWPTETSDCNNHDAIKLTNKRGEKNLAVTGIAMASCTQHECTLPQSVADLRLGEEARIDSYGGHLSLPDQVDPAKLQLLIPKFHLMGHQESCWHKYAFGYAKRTGRTDGEGVERVWAVTNSLAGSSKKMGPGGRWDMMDDHWNDRNHRKQITIALAMFNKAVHAAEQRTAHVIAYEELCESLNQDQMKKWRSEIRAWDDDHSKQNPYVSSVRPLQLGQIRLELAKEDAALARQSTIHSKPGLLKQMTPTALVIQGLELEEQQRRLIFDHTALGNHPTLLQLAKIVERSTNLRSRIHAWIGVQALYMPRTTLLRAEYVNQSSETCNVRLIDIEWRLRFAAAHDEVEKIRKSLLSRTSVINYKRDYGHGQRQGTRSAAVMDTLDNNINACAARYRIHHDMLLKYGATLGKNSSWMDSLRPLKQKDLRQPDGRLEDKIDGRGAGYVSWIWLATPSDVMSDQNVADCLRITFCKARSKALEWQEECLLIQEEMRRILQMLEAEAVEWDLRRESNVDYDPLNVGFEGRVAYTCRQASIRRKLAMIWRHIMDRLEHQI